MQSIRLTGTSYAVLILIDQAGEATPYDLKGALERSIANFWPVPHTTFYAEPERLVKGGYLQRRQESSGRRRKLYSLTDSGREALRSWASSPEAAHSQVRDEGTLKIFAGADPKAVFALQRESYVRKIEELEGYLELVEDSPPTRHTSAIRSTLLVGITYESALLRMVDALLDGGDPLERLPAGRKGAD